MWWWWLATGCAGDATVVAEELGSVFGATTTTRTPDGGTTTGAGGNLIPVNLDDVKVALHPAMDSILVVSWVQDGVADVGLVFSADGGETAVSPPRGLGPGAHEEWIVGVPFDAEVAWHIAATGGFGRVATEPQVTSTGPFPAGLQGATLLTEGAWDPAIPYVLASGPKIGGNFGSVWWAQIVDRQGRAVWALSSDSDHIIMHPRLSIDGLALLIDDNSFWGSFDGGLNSTVRRMTLDLEVTDEWVTPGLHHPFVELPGRVLAYGSMDFPYINEWLIETDVHGDARTVFDCEEWLDQDSGYCGSNTLNWREAEDDYLFSFYSLDSIFQIDPASGDVLRVFGHARGAYAFDPPESAFWWQHGGHYTDEGTLLTSTYLNEDGGETIVREYLVDEEGQRLVELRNFGVGEGLFGDQMGEVTRLPSGHTIHNLGTLPRLREFDEDGAVVWDVAWETGPVGRTTPLTSLYDLLPIRP